MEEEERIGGEERYPGGISENWDFRVYPKERRDHETISLKDISETERIRCLNTFRLVRNSFLIQFPWSWFHSPAPPTHDVTSVESPRSSSLPFWPISLWFKSDIRPVGFHEVFPSGHQRNRSRAMSCHSKCDPICIHSCQVVSLASAR